MENFQRNIMIAILSVSLAFFLIISIEIYAKFIAYMIPCINSGEEFIHEYNRDGLRTSYEIDAERDNKKRILFLGNSITLGLGVDVAGTFVKKLDEFFPSVEIINAGFDGGNFHMLSNAYRKKLFRYKPDYIIWIPSIGDLVEYEYEKFDLTDIEIPLPESYKQQIREEQKELELWPHQTLWLLKGVHKFLRSIKTNPVFPDQYTSAPDLWYTDNTNRRISLSNLRGLEFLLSDILKISDPFSRFFIVTVPSRHLSYTYSPGKRNVFKSLKYMANKMQKVEYYNLVGPISSVMKKSPQRFYQDFVHFNEQGHEIVFQQLLRIIELINDQNHKIKGS
ncbi:MAG: SGNH/GDSL hydrolase family protein [Oligoflexales bacterium]